MQPSLLSPAARQIESQFGRPSTTLLQNFLRDEGVRHAEASGFLPSDYDLYLVRRNSSAGDEVIGPKPLHAGTYSEEQLYGASGSPLARFRVAVHALQSRAERASALNATDVEFGHQVAIFWAELGRLKEFIGITATVSEIVAELRTARFQFLGKDTPPGMMTAMASALRLVAEAERIDFPLVDRVAEALESEGFDSLAQDVLRASDG